MLCNPPARPYYLRTGISKGQEGVVQCFRRSLASLDSGQWALLNKGVFCLAFKSEILALNIDLSEI